MLLRTELIRPLEHLATNPTERGNSVCKYAMEGESRKEHSEKGKFSRTIWHTQSDKKVDGVRIGDSGEEGGRDQTVKGYICMQKNLSQS